MIHALQSFRQKVEFLITFLPLYNEDCLNVLFNVLYKCNIQYKFPVNYTSQLNWMVLNKLTPCNFTLLNAFKRWPRHELCSHFSSNRILFCSSCPSLFSTLIVVLAVTLSLSPLYIVLIWFDFTGLSSAYSVIHYFCMHWKSLWNQIKLIFKSIIHTFNKSVI